MNNPVQDIIGQLPTPPPSGGPNASHLLLGGAGFTFMGWLVELKEMLEAVLTPVEHCETLAQAFWIYVHLDNTHYFGIAAWIAVFLVTTATGVGLIWALVNQKKKIKTKTPSQERRPDEA